MGFGIEMSNAEYHAHKAISKSKLDALDKEESYLREGLKEFKEDSWEPKVDRLHLPDEKTQLDLLNFLNSL